MKVNVDAFAAAVFVALAVAVAVVVAMVAMAVVVAMVVAIVVMTVVAVVVVAIGGGGGGGGVGGSSRDGCGKMDCPPIKNARKMTFCKRTLIFRVQSSISLEPSHVFRANRGPGVRGWPGNSGPSTESANGLAFPTKAKTFWVIKYLNIYPTNN